MRFGAPKPTTKLMQYCGPVKPRPSIGAAQNTCKIVGKLSLFRKCFEKKQILAFKSDFRLIILPAVHIDHREVSMLMKYRTDQWYLTQVQHLFSSSIMVM